MRVTFGTVVAIAAIGAVASYLYLSRDGRVETHEDWAVFAADQETGQICWIETGPVGGSPLFRRYGGTVKYTVDPDVLSFIAQGTEFPSPRGWLEIGEDRFALLFNGPSGWLRSNDDDPRIRDLFQKAGSASITSGNQGFTFSTRGFEPALGVARAICDGS